MTSTTVQNTAAEELTSDVADPPIGIDPVTPNCGDESELHNILVVFAEKKPGVSGVIHTL